jgi:hypothetical protein
VGRIGAVVLALLVVVRAPVSAQTEQRSIVVVPWTVGAGDASQLRTLSEAVVLSVPADMGTTISSGETRARYERDGSSPPPTVSSSELEQWTAYSREAVHDLADEDYAGAREALRHAQELSERAAAEMSREEARARQVLDTCLYGVRAYVEQQDPRAEEQALDCRRLVPRIAPTPNIHTPEVAELLSRVDRRLTSAHHGPLHVESQPSGCSVRLNGVLLGATPFVSEQLADGAYRVQVECGEGRRGRIHRVALPESGEVVVRVDARLDAAVRSDDVLRLEYDHADDAEVHRRADAAAIGAIVGATEVWLVRSGSDGALTGERIRVADGLALGSATAPAGSVTLLATTLAHADGGAIDTASRETSHRDDPTAAWVLTGIGGALAVAGAVMVGVSSGDVNAVSEPHGGETYAAARSREETGRIVLGSGAAIGGIGLVLAAVGLGWGLSMGSEDPQHGRVRIGPTGLSLTF